MHRTLSVVGLESGSRRFTLNDYKRSINLVGGAGHSLLSSHFSRDTNHEKEMCKASSVEAV